jgi:hypothetical protein
MLAATFLGAQPAFSHDGHTHEVDAATAPSVQLKVVPEPRLPFKHRGAETTGGLRSGSGAWQFAPEPVGAFPEVVQKNVRGAHGTIVIDKKGGAVYWGLQNVGWVSFREGFQAVSVVDAGLKLAKGNLHGAELRQQGRKTWIAAADDVESEVYLMDTQFGSVKTLGYPQIAPYSAAKEFHPTDVTFIDDKEAVVTDGYGKAYLAPIDVSTFSYKQTLFGGKKLSQTPHGVTEHKGKLIVAARPEAGIITWDRKKEAVEEILRLPPGSTVCDVDVWEEYALAPCLNGPNNAPGPIYIVNLKTKAIASVIRPKEELGFGDAQHIHDAAWHVTGRGRNREVRIVFTNWNPGGFGVIRLLAAGASAPGR